MDRKKYRTIETLVTILLAVAVYSLWEIGKNIFHTGSFPLLILEVGVVVAAFIVFFLFKQWVKAEDERVIAISEKAARKTIYLFGIILLSTSILFRWAGDSTLSSSNFQESISTTEMGAFLNSISIILMISAVGLWTLYLVFYDYYSRKFGDLGKDYEE
jgi:uncharacterized membrane protein